MGAASVFDFDSPPVPAAPTPAPAMVPHTDEVDPFAEIDAPPPPLLYGGMPGQRMGQQQMGQPQMGQQQMGQPQMGFYQPQQAFPGGFPMQQQQMPQQTSSGGVPGYSSS